MNGCRRILVAKYRQPGGLETPLNHLGMSLPPSLSNKTAYTLNVTTLASVAATAISQKNFAIVSPIYFLKSILSGPTIYETLKAQPICIIFTYKA